MRPMTIVLAEVLMGDARMAKAADDGFTDHGGTRIVPGTFKHTKLAKPPVPIQVGIVLHKGRLHFTSSSHLWSYKAPGLE